MSESSGAAAARPDLPGAVHFKVSTAPSRQRVRDGSRAQSGMARDGRRALATVQVRQRPAQSVTIQLVHKELRGNETSRTEGTTALNRTTAGAICSRKGIPQLIQSGWLVRERPAR